MARPRQVAVILNLAKAYDRQIAAGVARYSRAVGHWSLYVEDEPLTRLPAMAQWGGDGVIASLDDPRVARLVRRMRLPLVGVGGGYGGYDRRSATVFVDTDNAAIARLAADHLIACGCRRLGYCGFRPTRVNGWSADRAAAFADRARAAGVPCSVFTGRYATARKWRPMIAELADWIDAQPKPLGLLAADDQRARHVVEACRRINADIPHGVALVGVDDDSLMGALTEPALTSIIQGTDQIGYEAAHRLDRLMRRRRVTPRRAVVPPVGLVVRQSTAPVGHNDPLVERAMRLIDQGLADRVTVTRIADVCGVSRSTLDLHFDAAIGRSAHAEIVRRQVERAARLLVTTDLPLDTVAARCGFNHANYLSRVFRSHHGVPPGTFRRAAGSPASAVADSAAHLPGVAASDSG